MPQSGAASGEPIGLDKAVEIFDRLASTSGYIVDLPQDEMGRSIRRRSFLTRWQ